MASPGRGSGGRFIAKKAKAGNVSTAKSFHNAARVLREWAKELDKTVPSGIRLIAEEIMTDVKNSRPGKGVPKDKGDLASTGRVRGGGKVARTGRFGMARVSLSFGGHAAPYALVQHERLDYNHKLGEARYLVRGVERWKPDGSAAIGAWKATADLATKRVAARNRAA